MSRNKKQSILPVEYATITQSASIAKTIDGFIKSKKLPGRAEGIWSRLNQPHIRIKDAIPTVDHVTLVQEALQVLMRPADRLTSTVSGQYVHNTYNFDVDSIIYTIVFAAKGARPNSTGAQISKQQLRPNKLGLTSDGTQYTKQSLADAAKSALVTRIKDPLTLNALTQLLDVALDERDVIDSELSDYISEIVGDISQDFGEILAPIMLANNSLISFPKSSNEMLVDAEVDGHPIAVKSLGGSGNSFAAIRETILLYQLDNKNIVDQETKEILNLIGEFISNIGSTNDNLIRTAQIAKLPEAIALNKLLGATPMTFIELLESTKQLYKTLLETHNEDSAYKEYIRMVLPVARSGGWNKPLGMPSDWRRYSDEYHPTKEDLEKPAKRTGKTSFDKNFPLYAARQLTYLLGVAFDKEMNEGPRAKKMCQILKEIMSHRNASAVKIDITKNGGLAISQTPFGSVNWRYQYHAATDAPDRNAPGFAMKLL